MKFTEKAEEVCTTIKSPSKQRGKPLLQVAEEARRKPENAGRSPRLFPTSSGISRIHVRKKFVQNPFVFATLLKPAPFFRFFCNNLGFTGSRIPSLREKMPVTMRPYTRGERPETTDGLRAVGILPDNAAAPEQSYRPSPRPLGPLGPRSLPLPRLDPPARPPGSLGSTPGSLGSTPGSLGSTPGSLGSTPGSLVGNLGHGLG